MIPQSEKSVTLQGTMSRTPAHTKLLVQLAYHGLAGFQENTNVDADGNELNAQVSPAKGLVDGIGIDTHGFVSGPGGGDNLGYLFCHGG
jgi:hypothetical protein